MNKKLTTYPWKKIKQELLQDKQVRAEYERLQPRFQVACQLIELRLRRNLTQKQLADQVGLKQSNIARLESFDYQPRLATLQKIAQATGTKLKISLVD